MNKKTVLILGGYVVGEPEDVVKICLAMLDVIAHDMQYKQWRYR